MKYKVIDLFAGVGGLSYGFANSNHFEIVLANEIDKDMAQAYKLNHPSVPMLCDDIKNITKSQLDNFIHGQVDIVIGGPPCQSYSTLGKRLMDDRASLFREYCRMIDIIQPKLFLFENVSGLLSMQNGNLIKIIKTEFIKLGYDVKLKILNAVHYGVPQYRDRVILVGMKNKNVFEYPEGEFGDGLLPLRTVEDALSDLPSIHSGEENNNYCSEPLNDLQHFFRSNNSVLADNNSPKNSERLIKIMESLPDGGSKKDLPIEIRPKSGYGNTYAKMWWKKPAPTITRNFATPSSSRCVHPRDSRALTTREGARLQSFPDHYKFYGSTSKKNLQIGNAVPPLLSIALAKKVYEAIIKK